jgi:FkbM family methyltransferase
MTLAWVLRRLSFRGQGRLASRIPVPRFGERLVGFPHGLRLRLDLRDPVQRDYLVGIYDRHEFALVRRVLQDGGDVVDVGAHVGAYSVVASLAERGMRGRVAAVEPNAAARRRLLANLRLNRCENVTVIPAAASSCEGETTLYVPREGQSSWATLEPDRVDDVEGVRVAQTTVDAVVEQLGLEPVLLKIDVEGRELDVLDGAEVVLRKRPVILAEVSGKTGLELVRRLAPLGYRVRRIMPRSLRPYEPVPGIVNVLATPRHLWGRI